jgi:hypothetical protein
MGVVVIQHSEHLHIQEEIALLAPAQHQAPVSLFDLALALELLLQSCACSSIQVNARHNAARAFAFGDAELLDKRHQMLDDSKEGGMKGLS